MDAYIVARDWAALVQHCEEEELSSTEVLCYPTPPLNPRIVCVSLKFAAGEKLVKSARRRSVASLLDIPTHWVLIVCIPRVHAETHFIDNHGMSERGREEERHSQ